MAEESHGRADRSSGAYHDKWDKFAKDQEKTIDDEQKAEEEKANAALGLKASVPKSQVHAEEQRKREALKVVSPE